MLCALLYLSALLQLAQKNRSWCSFGSTW